MPYLYNTHTVLQQDGLYSTASRWSTRERTRVLRVKLSLLDVTLIQVPARSENDMTRLWNSSKPPRSNCRANVLNVWTGLMKICGARDMLCTPFVMLMKPFRQYNLVSGSDAQTLEQMEPKPKLSDLYLPSPGAT